jgi:ABC-type multidrug transport system fused ATPase/permease subunit
VQSMAAFYENIMTDLRTRLFSHILQQSMAFFSLNSTGKLMSRIGNDVEQLQEVVSASLGEFVREIFMLVALIVAILVLDWKLAVISFLIAPLAGLRIIKAFSMEEHEEHRFSF